jgi:hypothetical protein
MLPSSQVAVLHRGVHHLDRVNRAVLRCTVPPHCFVRPPQYSLKHPVGRPTLSVAGTATLPGDRFGRGHPYRGSFARERSHESKQARRSGAAVDDGRGLGLAALVFIPAWTIHYWQAWGFTVVFVLSTNAVGAYVALTDPALLKRRRRIKEQRPTQRVIVPLEILTFNALVVVSALDHRFGWSHMAPIVSVGGDLLFGSVSSFCCWSFEPTRTAARARGGRRPDRRFQRTVCDCAPSHVTRRRGHGGGPAARTRLVVGADRWCRLSGRSTKRATNTP